MRKRIVIVDDDPVVRLMLRMLLREHEYDVVGEASDGGDGLELCATHEPDVLFLDIHMPRLSGLDALASIRGRFPTLGVIMISSSATPDNVREAIRHGANGFVVKPFKVGAVLDAITKCQSSAQT